MSATSQRPGRDPRRAAIAQLYVQVDAPAWASPNLDGLADVLRDLSWRPAGPVAVRWRPSSALPEPDRRAIEAVLQRAVDESTSSPHPVVLR